MAFDDCLKHGGFPYVLNLEDKILKQDVHKGIYHSMILKDVSLRSKLANVDMLLRISLFKTIRGCLYFLQGSKI